MSIIIETLRHEHAEFERLLGFLERELARLQAGRAPNYEMLDALLDFFSSFPDEWHHPKEDVVYDALLASQPDLSSRIGDLRVEHERLEQGSLAFQARVTLLRRGSDLPAKMLVQLGESYSGQLRHHISKEDEFFFPLALDILNDDDWHAIAEIHEKIGCDPLKQTVIENNQRLIASIASMASGL